MHLLNMPGDHFADIDKAAEFSKASGTPMILCVSYPVDVCYVIIYTKKNRVNQNIEMLLMSPVLLPAIPPTFFTRPESGFGLL